MLSWMRGRRLSKIDAIGIRVLAGKSIHRREKGFSIFDHPVCKRGTADLCPKPVEILLFSDSASLNRSKCSCTVKKQATENKR